MRHDSHLWPFIANALSVPPVHPGCFSRLYVYHHLLTDVDSRFQNIHCHSCLHGGGQLMPCLSVPGKWSCLTISGNYQEIDHQHLPGLVLENLGHTSIFSMYEVIYHPVLCNCMAFSKNYYIVIRGMCLLFHVLFSS